MIALTPEQVTLIRRFDRHVFADSKMDDDDFYVPPPTLLALMRLGLCVVESGVGPYDCENVANAWLSMRSGGKEARVMRLLELIDDELNREEKP